MRYSIHTRPIGSVCSRVKYKGQRYLCLSLAASLQFNHNHSSILAMHFSTLLSLATTAVASTSALGINCRGSGLCASNKGLLGEAQAQLRGMDQNQKFSDGQHVTCVKSSVTIGNPSLCIFYQKTNGRSWTVGQTVNYVQALLDHGCGACGSKS